MEKEKLFVNGETILFEDLAERAQKRVYLRNKEKFEKEAALSKYPSVRELVVKDAQADKENLDRVFLAAVAGKEENTKIDSIWNHPNFQKTDEKRQMLIKTGNLDYIAILVRDTETSSPLLNELIRTNNMVYGLVNIAVKNKSFKMEEETRELLSNCAERLVRLIVARDEGSSSKILNKMLRAEMKRWDKEDIIESILANPNFNMEDETRKLLATSTNYIYRCIAARDKGTSNQFLNWMYREEMNSETMWWPSGINLVLNEIEANKKFKMSTKTRDVYASSEDSLKRVRVAKYKGTSSKFLIDMYVSEIKRDRPNAYSVLKAIKENAKFRLDEAVKERVMKLDSYRGYHELVDDPETSSKMLNEIMRSLIFKMVKAKEQKSKEEFDVEWVMEKIIRKPNFWVEEETMQLCEKSATLLDSKALEEVRERRSKQQEVKTMLEKIRTNKEQSVEEVAMQVCTFLS